MSAVERTADRSSVNTAKQPDLRRRCEENAPRLRRQKSTLVFALRTQEFVELIKADATHEALAYAREHLVPFAQEHLAQFKRVLVLLVFRRHTKCARYRALLEGARWEVLAGQFLTELLKTCSLSPVPQLELQLQVRARFSWRLRGRRGARVCVVLV